MAKPFSAYLRNARFICANVESVSPTHLTLTPLSSSEPPKKFAKTENSENSEDSENGKKSEVLENPETLKFDYLCVCLGTHYPFFKPSARSLAERTEEVTAFTQRVRDAQHVLVVGGRAVGVEFLGSLVERYGEKKVTIVHSRNSLMDIWPSGAQNKLNAFLATKPNVTVVSYFVSLHPPIPSLSSLPPPFPLSSPLPSPFSLLLPPPLFSPFPFPLPL